MVATERAFAKLSEEQGTREAFMAFIADDGILFRPTAVKGKQWMKDHPVPSSDKRPLLSWYPAVAGMARAGDLGYTTGPWEFRNDIHDARPVAWGHFLTIWKKQADGSWRFAIDLGISNPQPALAAAPWKLSENYKTPGRMKGIWSFSDDALLARDREFAKAAAKFGAHAAFGSYAAPDVRLYRDGKFPLLGPQLAPAVLPSGANVWTGNRPLPTCPSQTIRLHVWHLQDRSWRANREDYRGRKLFSDLKKEGGDWKVHLRSD